jgi:hypothetical protein
LSRKNRSAIKEKRSATITASKPAPPPLSLETVPSSVSKPVQRTFPWPTVGVLALLCVGGFAVLYFWNRDQSSSEPPKGIVEPAWEDSDEWALLRRFAELKNSNNPKFRELLGAEPAIPDHPISAAEAAVLESEAYLRQAFEVEKIRPQSRETSGPQVEFALVVHGAVTSPRLQILNGEKVDVVTRVITNPELIVRVEDGKVVGVKAQVQGESNQKPMSREQERLIKKAFGVK